MTDPATPIDPSVGPQTGNAFRNRGFLFYWIARTLSGFSTQIISVAVGWQVYDITRDPFDLGLVGLVQFAPALLLVLITGSVSDRFNRRLIMSICLLAEGLCAAAIFALTLSGLVVVWPIFAVLVCFGIARAFFNPAAQSLIANIVPPEDINNAIAWNSSGWQIATITGPVAGGLLYGVLPEAAYATAFLLMVVGSALMLWVPRPAQKTLHEKASWETLIAGFRYVWHEKVVLGAISLDLFAVLLGGATALLPVYARDILDVGPWGLGLLRGGTGIGAVTVAIYLGFRPIRDQAGLLMFVFVGFFGLFTVVFGLSTIVWLSIVALILMGACDMVSVYIRETLIQLWTPDAVRGRVNAVNMVFIGASNELGEFRAGVSAALIGAVPAVVFGGIGTIAVAGIWAYAFPALRRARHLTGRV
ncbi:MFS transporter [Microbaculum marinum]|uniref:MFS transporter n=1 Tax=Microbaculum marinum TaxID=1764581 RepID=A0AAW9RPY1_9HYPH